MVPRQMSISTSFDYSLPLSSQLPLIADAGFTHVSLGENVEHSGYGDPSRQRQQKTLLQAYNLRLDTIHGPRVDQFANSSITATIAAAVELEAPVVVAHGGPFDIDGAEVPQRLTALLRGCAAVAPLLEQSGVTLALENVMPGPATDVVRLAHPNLDPRLFGLCYDSAHD
jgi:sugar phosphate isomerase/epimerase